MMKNKVGSHRAHVAYMFLIPFFVLFLVFYVAPLVYTGYLSFFVRRGIFVQIFVGFQNFARVFQDAQFFASLANIGKFFIIQAPIMLVLAIVFAMYIDRRSNPLRTTFRLVYYLPFTVSSVVAGLMWGFMFSKNLSPFNALFGLIGIKPDFLASAHLLWTIGIIVTWEWTGYNMIIMYSTLQSIEPALIDAAEVDGAGKLQIILRIKLPLLLPAIILALIFTIIGTSQIFNEPFVLQALTFVSPHLTPNMYIYTTAFSYASFNYAGAMAIVLAIITFVISFVFIRYNRLEEE
jgi:multiple sugar transport system permease protein